MYETEQRLRLAPESNSNLCNCEHVNVGRVCDDCAETYERMVGAVNVGIHNGTAPIMGTGTQLKPCPFKTGGQESFWKTISQALRLAQQE